MIWPFSKYSPEEKRVKPRLYASIDRATYERLSAPNLASNLDVLNVINTALSPEYASVKTCKRLGIKIRGGFQNVQVLSLHILCLCVRHCGDAFQRTLAKSDLLKDLGRIGDRTMWTATDIHRMVLHLLQEWAFEVKNYPDFQLMYNYLRSKNAPFEPRNGPIGTIFQPYPGIEEQLMQLQRGSMIGGSAGDADGDAAGANPNNQNQGGDGQEQRPGSGGSALIGPDLLRPDRTVDVLKSDLEVARGTVALLDEVMDKIKAEGNWEGIREEYCVEVAEACLAVQKRIEVLMGGELEDESVMATALEVNDLALVALKVRMELLEIADGTREAPEAEGSKTTEGIENVNEVTTNEPPPLIDLLDLDYEPEGTTSSDKQQSSQTNAVDPFAHLEQDVSNPFASHETIAAMSMAKEEVDSNSNALDDTASAPVISSMVDGFGDAGGGSGGNPFADDFEDAPSATPIAPSGMANGTEVANIIQPLRVPTSTAPQNGGPRSAPAQVTKNALFVSGTTFPETFEAGPSTVPRRHTMDAFEGLVNIRKKDEKPTPDPPRGPSMKPTSPSTASDAFNAFDSLG